MHGSISQAVTVTIGEGFLEQFKDFLEKKANETTNTKKKLY